MTCPNCGKELKEGEVCTCTQNNEVQDEKPIEEINEEYTQNAEASTEIQPENEETPAPTEETPIAETAQAPNEPEQPVYQSPEQQNESQQSAYYNPYDNAAYYQQNDAQYTQQAPYYVYCASFC